MHSPAGMRIPAKRPNNRSAPRTLWRHNSAFRKSSRLPILQILAALSLTAAVIVCRWGLCGGIGSLFNIHCARREISRVGIFKCAKLGLVRWAHFSLCRPNASTRLSALLMTSTHVYGSQSPAGVERACTLCFWSSMARQPGGEILHLADFRGRLQAAETHEKYLWTWSAPFRKWRNLSKRDRRGIPCRGVSP